MSTARFALICTVLVVLIFSLSAALTGAVVLAILAGLLAFLKDHRKLYFQFSRKSLFTYAAYPFAIVIMAWTTVCAIPGIGRLIPWNWQLPDPFPAAYWFHFALGSLFLLCALRPKNPNAHPMSFTGSVFWEQASLLKEAPRMILESLKRAATAITQEHWLKGIAGVVLLVLSKRHLRRRSAVEPEIGHMKSDGLLGRNFLKGMQGDAINAILCGAGHNLRKILARLRALLCLLPRGLRTVLQALIDGLEAINHPQRATKPL